MASKLLASDRLKDMEINNLISALRYSKRPVLVGGWGIRLGRCEKQFNELARLLRIPVVLTWAVLDVLEQSSSIKCVGSFGTHGNRLGNVLIHNADFILSIGCRLDSKATGTHPINLPRRKKVCR